MRRWGSNRSTPTPPKGNAVIRSSLLLGSNYETLGDVAIEEITPQLAIGISRGRFRKGYPHVDPNEDAVIVAADDATTVLAVADGHNGFDAAGSLQKKP